MNGLLSATVKSSRQTMKALIKLLGCLMIAVGEIQIKFIWARRRFVISASQSEALAVLRWNRIASGAAAFINGQKVGENEPTGPFQMIVWNASH